MKVMPMTAFGNKTHFYKEFINAKGRTSRRNSESKNGTEIEIFIKRVTTSASTSD